MCEENPEILRGQAASITKRKYLRIVFALRLIYKPFLYDKETLPINQLKSVGPVVAMRYFEGQEMFTRL